MSLSSILFLFLTHLGIGIALVLAWVGKDAGVKFFRFNAGTAVILIAIGFALRTDAPSAHATIHLISIAALLAAEAALLLYWATIGRTLAKVRPLLLWTAIVGGLLAITMQALEISAGAPGLMPLLTVASFLTSTALLGGACGAMVLGHWYLVVPSLDVKHLQSIVKLHIVSLVVRAVVVLAALIIAIVTWQPGMGPNFQRYILSTGGIFFWQRVLFGLCGPGLLAYMTWETAKIQSTQSATGILYVDFFTVIVGEVLAKYLLLSTNIPSLMQIVAKCPKCDAGLPVNAPLMNDAPESIRCGRCGHELALSFSDALRADTKVDNCPVCRGADFYLRKDFDPKMGLTVVIIGALISAGFYWFGRDLIAYSILGGAALIDLFVYGRLGDVTVCYRCHSEFRGKYLRTARHFDLHTADVLEQEYERKIGRR